MLQDTTVLQTELFLIKVKTDGTLIIPEGFDLEEYSEFKYGSRKVVAKYAECISNYLQKNMILANEGNNVLVTTTRKLIRQGVTSLVEELVKLINFQNYQSNGQIVDMAQITIWTPTGEYGAKSEKERREIMAASDFTIDSRAITGKHVLIIDDLVASGQVRDRLIYTVKENLPKSCRFLSLTRIVSESGDFDPRIESVINRKIISSWQSVLRLCDIESYYLTSRLCKTVLGLDRKDLELLIDSLKHNILYEIIAQSICEGYFAIPEYKSNGDFLVNYLSERINKLS
ncbi:MAG: phosphoribosyltransferase family protein [Patescibacteria group bacterium]